TALASYRSALELFESDRGKLQDDTDRSGYFANKLTFYYRPIGVLLEKRNYAAAFDLFERSKARHGRFAGQPPPHLSDQAGTSAVCAPDGAAREGQRSAEQSLRPRRAEPTPVGDRARQSRHHRRRTKLSGHPRRDERKRRQGTRPRGIAAGLAGATAGGDA